VNGQPRLGILAWFDIPADCEMSGVINEDGDVRFTVSGPYDEWDIEFEATALDRFLRLGFELLCESARVNPKALAARDGIRDAEEFAFRAEALRKLVTLSEAARTRIMATPAPIMTT
jgi:hypothetical protein